MQQNRCISTIAATVKILFIACSFVLSFISYASDATFGGKTQFLCATVDQARQILTNRDDFISRLSSFDRAARLKSSADVTEAQFLAFVATNILPFEEREAAMVKQSLKKLETQIEPFNLPWPETILFIKTTGQEEGDAAYTRATAIILPRSKLGPRSGESIDDLICHELFHVLSRHQPALKEKLYNVIGFHRCDELPFPPALVRITNPDAPKNDHWIGIKRNGAPLSAIPILFAQPPKYDTSRGGEFFQYVQFKLLVVQTNGLTGINYDSARPQLLDPREAEGFFEQVGQNTQYIIHPEEILADNFKLLITGRTNARSPQTLTKMKSILLDRAN